jgi:ribosome-associated protein
VAIDVLSPGSGVRIPAGFVTWAFGPSGGPGGQHANKANTRAEATLDLVSAPGIPETARRRLIEKLGPRLVVVVDDERSQLRNRTIAIERIEAKLQTALHRPKPRRQTKPSRGSVRRRLDTKQRRSEVKRGRGRVQRDD